MIYKKQDIPCDLLPYFEPAEIGREQTPSEYIDNLVEVFTEVYRVLKPTGTVWVNIGDGYFTKNPNNRNFINNGGRKSNNPNITKHKECGLKNKDLIGVPWMLAFALRDKIGFYLRNDIIWHRPNQMPESVTDRCVKSHEHIFMFTKSEKYYFDYKAIQEPAITFENRPFGIQRERLFDYNTKSLKHPEAYLKNNKNLHRDGQTIQGMHRNRAEGGKDEHYTVRNKRDVWSVNTQPSSVEHIAMYPEKLIMPCILAGCPQGGIVYDPFIGSGTTALAVIHSLNNRNFIGSELSKEYTEIAQKRIQIEKSQLTLF